MDHVQTNNKFKQHIHVNNQKQPKLKIHKTQTQDSQTSQKVEMQ
jgi:hypothetical protein